MSKEREALEKVKKDVCCSNGDCEHCEYDEYCFGYDAQQALKGTEQMDETLDILLAEFEKGI